MIVEFFWIPGHSVRRGNKIDDLVRAGTGPEPSVCSEPSVCTEPSVCISYTQIGKYFFFGGRNPRKGMDRVKRLQKALIQRGEADQGVKQAGSQNLGGFSDKPHQS